jgi:hypothetical protein
MISATKMALNQAPMRHCWGAAVLFAYFTALPQASGWVSLSPEGDITCARLHSISCPSCPP